MNWAFKPNRSEDTQTNVRLLSLLALLVGFGLRLYHLGAESLWYDETVSVALAQKAVPELIRHTAGDIHPPGYYLLLHTWQALTHPTPAFGLEFLYAWPSLCGGVIVMVLLFTLGRTLANVRIALLALWLAALNPYHIWYSQEVRMYTLGAALGLLCLWAMLQWWQLPSAGLQWRWLTIYIVGGTVGLYILYYFLFTLIALNGIALWLWQRQRQSTAHRLGAWLLAQGAILLLWSPWVPIFWRQITEPPVPPWRMPWATGNQLLAAMAESASALLSGQSTPAPTSWLWLLVFFSILLIAHSGYANNFSTKAVLSHANQPHASQPANYPILLAYLLMPLVVIMAVTLWVTPLYHVRYLFTYAPVMVLLLAMAFAYLHSQQRLLGVGGLIAFLLLNGWSLYNFWYTPAFNADDQRTAVAQVAQGWRPGDAILVNAGWVYTALTTYWPTELVGVDAANPPALDELIRLIDYPVLQQQPPQPGVHAGPIAVRTGSIDGAPSLGWSDPASDFFAISRAATTDGLATLAQHYRRLWHYRLYDTVNDPQGLIRTWLESNNTLLAEKPIPGRDYLRVQLYQSTQASAVAAGWIMLPLQPVRFAGDLQLQQAALSAPTVAAGTYLYTQVTWQPPVERATLPAVISFSLRLYTDDGHLLAQADETPMPPVAAWPTPYVYAMALPVPVATPPGAYQLVLLAYDQQSGVPLAVQGMEPQRSELSLGAVQVEPAIQAPVVTEIQASFDYIDLLRARLSTASAAPGSALELELVWRPRANPYRDTYLAQITLQNGAGQVAGQWEAALGGWHYPSGTWPPRIPVRDWRSLSIAPTTPPGIYTVVMQVRRDRDKQLLPARHGWWPSGEEALVIGTVEIR